MSERTLSWLTLLCCLLLLAAVAWGALQVRDLAGEWQRRTELRSTKHMSITTRDVENLSGTKADITTTKLDSETLDAWLARHLEAVMKWRNTTG
jgi:hypothetical protein